MDPQPTAQELRGAARALRFTLAALDESDRLEAGGDPADASRVTMELDEARALVPVLAQLLVATMRELAGRELLTDDPAEQDRATRKRLQGMIESMELSATFADVEAEMGDDDGR